MQQAAASGVFGRCAEECVELVDASDTDFVLAISSPSSENEEF